jgi:hypothetical protein
MLDIGGTETPEPDQRPGFRPTAKYGQGVSLGTAMAISGAAASPNMGYHTTPALAFLMTVFNVRLGWWMGNTLREKWERQGPRLGLMYLLGELFGITDAQRSYVYLSDGGHFENLGLYELVRRRCLFIVACDAEQDAGMTFSGLGNAIEKCRADFGVDIQIDIGPLRESGEKSNGKDERYRRRHWTLGKISYGETNGKKEEGILLYIKASLTGDEPADVLRYAFQQKDFPHQTTADQWFDEAQLESYRALGLHTMEIVWRAVEGKERSAKEEMDASLMVFKSDAVEAERRIQNLFIGP